MSEWGWIAEWKDGGREYRLAARDIPEEAAEPASAAPAARPPLRERAEHPSRGSGHTQPRADIDVAFKRSDSTWEIECPEHGWHAAVEFGASGEMPAVVKCTAKVGDKHCNVKVPLEVAERKVGRR